MTERKHKQAVSCEGKHNCTSLHSVARLNAPSPPQQSVITHRLARAKLDAGATLRRPQTRDRRQAHTDSLHTGKARAYRQERAAESKSSVNVYQHIREEPKQPAAAGSWEISGIYRGKSKHFRMCVCQVYLELRILQMTRDWKGHCAAAGGLRRDKM